MMKFGRLKKLNLSVLVIIAAYVALGAYGYALYQKQQEKSVMTSSDAAAIKPLQNTPAKSNGSIAKHHVFGVAPDKVKELKGAKWKLKGIVVDADNQGVIIVKVGNEEKILKAGDKIDSKTLIKKIEREKIMLMVNGELQMLPIFKEEKGQPIKVNALPVAPRESQGARSANSNRQMPSAEQLEKLKEQFRNRSFQGNQGYGLSRGYENPQEDSFDTQRYEMTEEQAERIQQFRENFRGRGRGFNR